MKATVQIELEQLDQIRQKTQRLERELGDARRTIESARLGPDDSDLRRSLATLQGALVVVQFAIATMDPLTVRGWPYRELFAIAEALPLLPSSDSSWRELAVTIREFAIGAKSWEDTRALGLEQERLAEENAQRGAGNVLSAWGRPDRE